MVSTLANSSALGVWRMLTDDSSTMGRPGRSAFTRRAKAVPSMSGMCMSVITTSKCSPDSSAAIAACGRSQARYAMPQRSDCRLRMRRLVALSSTSSARLPRSSGRWAVDTASTGIAASVSRLK